MFSKIKNHDSTVSVILNSILKLNLQASLAMIPSKLLLLDLSNIKVIGEAGPEFIKLFG